MTVHEEITLELARLQRRAIEAVRERNATQQLGEAWQGIHEQEDKMATQEELNRMFEQQRLDAARTEGLKTAANWLRRQANAEKEPKARAAFIEAHNAILALAEGRA
jgi:ABC-type nitrate/sulfonate/bicarbonate transport system substrate-binding protein